MGKSNPGAKKCKELSNDNKIKDKYKTEFVLRAKNKELSKQGYNTTPGDKFTSRNADGHQLDKQHHKNLQQFEYIRHNLYIKSCLEGRDALRFQVKKISFRNYTPKILNQEVNMGMWI